MTTVRTYRVKVLSDPHVIMNNGKAEVVVVVLPLSIEEVYGDEAIPDGYIGPRVLLPLPASLRCETQKGDEGLVYEGGNIEPLAIPRALIGTCIK